MICRNGGRLASNCLGKRSGTVAERGFYDVFWRWSTVGCQAPRRGRASTHTNDARTSIQPVHGNKRMNPLPPLSYTPKPSATDKPHLTTSLRLLMRTLPHSVVVVTSSNPPPLKSPSPTIPQHYRGMTVSSFTTITLTPTPIISFNVKFPSHTLSAIQKSRQFLVHILEASENGARIADSFTKGSKFVERLLEGNEKGVGILPVVVGITGEEEGKEMGIKLPMLKAEGVSRVLRCKVLSESEGRSGLVEVGDHVIVIARVEEIFETEGEGKGEGKGGLCYANGKYRRVGNVIKVVEDVGDGKKDGEK
ncbi:hypothetical protein N431DRAFT_553724 [Stipitochalara longipes BDJ]|nr:hypothetical protein N431DRAFT_553724 [Stipitochalara longipes BDJ]